jgi:dipeptidyl-peptidase-4
MAPAAGYFIDTYSNIQQPPRMDLCRSDGKILRRLGDRNTEQLQQYELGRVEIFSIPTEGGYTLPALWVLPPELEAGRRYPVVFQVYGGPEAAAVTDRFRYLRDHFLAQQGIITLVKPGCQ